MIVGTFSNDEASIMNICHNSRHLVIVDEAMVIDFKKRLNSLSIAWVEAFLRTEVSFEATVQSISLPTPIRHSPYLRPIGGMPERLNLKGILKKPLSDSRPELAGR
jgi:hypothetical protein